MKKSVASSKLEELKRLDFDYDEEVTKMMGFIKEDSLWLDKVKKQAILKNITLEENIRDNAEWMINQRFN